MGVVFEKYVSGLTLIILAGLLLLVSGEVFAAGGRADYDLDDDGLIEINDLADLNEIRNDLAGASLYGNSTGCPVGGCFGYELTNDLDFDTNADGAVDSLDDYYNGGAFWLPIGDNTNPFTGTFSGNGFVIRNLVVYQYVDSYAGLFGVIDGATVTDLGVLGDLTSVYGNSYVGAIAGKATNGSTINNCFTGGTIDANVGPVGGIVGSLTQSTITASFSTAAVSATSTGICGGLAGMASTGTIENSFAAGSVAGPQLIGGLVGAIVDTTILNSYAAGPVSGNSSVGGLTGFTSGSNAMTAGYWDTEASGQATSGGALGTGLTTAEMQCPTGPDDTGCKAGTTIYQGWSATNWDFGTSGQYPALILHSQIYRDSDGDHYFNFEDAFPADPTEWLDSDGDGIGDNSDAFPTDPTEWLDSDGDGVGDNSDIFPTWPTEWSDTDGDGVGDNSDNCPDVANADQADSDLGGITGSLDRTFGGDVSPVNGIPDGFVIHAVSGSLLNSALAAVTDTGGNIYLAGHTYNASTGFDMALWRFTPAGALDTSFGGGAGYVIHHDAAGGNSHDNGYAVALDASGNIYVAGSSTNANGNDDLALWRFTPTGTVDTSFGGGAGYVIHHDAAGGNGNDVGKSVALDASGKIYVTGRSTNANGDHDLALWRFTSAGTLDTSFGGGAGYVIHHDAAGGNGNDVGNSVALDASGNIYVAGQSKSGNNYYHMVLWRFTPGGTLDTSFGGGAGYVVQSNTAGGDRDDVGNALKVGADGKIYVAGYSYGLTSKWDVVLWRYTPAGDLDTSFGGGTGYVTHNNAAGGNGDDIALSVVLDASGNIYVTGNSDSVSSGKDMALWRFTPAGNLDTGFGGGAGFVAYDIDSHDGGAAVTLDADGNVFVAGFAGKNGAKAMLWRFSSSPDGIGDACDNDIDGDGLLNSDEENIYGTDPLVSDADADTDGDGISNVDEVDTYGTDFADADSDDDGLSDGDEITVYYTDPTVSDADADTDGDGVSNVDEVDIYGTDPTVADSSAVNQGADSGGCFINSVQVYLYR